jgi:hypothetical protein
MWKDGFEQEAKTRLGRPVAPKTTQNLIWVRKGYLMIIDDDSW